MMNVVIRTGLALALATGLIGSSAAAQQSQPPQQEQQRAKTPEPVSGELISLDATAKTLVVKTAPDKEMTFSYNDTTEIIGADKGASGLATMSGATVVVHYEVHGTANTATKIEVTPKK
jgi:hypothetical protein